MEERLAEIRLRGTRAGLLHQRAEGSVFVYDTSYLDGGAEEIGLGFDFEATDWPGGLHPFFEALVPEGPRRRREARLADLPVQDDLGLLLAFGTDLMGAVTVHPADEGGTAGTGTAWPIPYGDAPLPETTLASLQDATPVTVVGGIYQPVPPGRESVYLARLPCADVPNLPENEDLCFRVARLLLGRSDLAEGGLGPVATVPGSSMVLRRLDRSRKLEPLRFETAQQILQRPRAADFTGKYDGQLEEIAGLIQQLSAVPVIDQYKLLQRLILFCLLDHADAHLGAFAFVAADRGFRLAPVTGLVNMQVYLPDGESPPFALTIGGQRVRLGDITRDLLVEFGTAMGLTDRAIERAFNDIARKRAAVFDRIDGQAATAPDWRHRFDSAVRTAWSRLF